MDEKKIVKKGNGRGRWRYAIDKANYNHCDIGGSRSAAGTMTKWLKGKRGKPPKWRAKKHDREGGCRKRTGKQIVK